MRETNSTQRRKAATVIDQSSPVSNPATADLVRTRRRERTLWRTSSPARPSHLRGMLRKQPASHRRVRQGQVKGTSYLRSAMIGRSLRSKGRQMGRKARFPRHAPTERRPRKGAGGRPEKPRNTSLRLCVFAPLRFCLIVLGCPLCLWGENRRRPRCQPQTIERLRS